MRATEANGLFVAAIALTVATLTTLSIEGCGTNAFMGFADKSSDDALYFDAQMKMDKRDWTGAIASFQKMTSTALAQPSTIANYASAYAGRCGLDVVALAHTLSSQSSANLFASLLVAFKGSTATQTADCAQAIAKLQTIGIYSSSRTIDENVLMSFIALADIGARLAAAADVAPADGVVDSGWDSCTSASFGPPQVAPGGAADASARLLGVDLNILINSLSAPGMPNFLGALQGQLTAFCAAIYAAFPTYAICGGPGLMNMNPAAWTQLQTAGIEGIVRSADAPGLAITPLHLGPPAGGAFCM